MALNQQTIISQIRAPIYSRNRDLLLEGGLVLFDLLPGELVELGVDVDHSVLDLHFVTVVERLVDLLAPDEDGVELLVGGHFCFSTLYTRISMRDEVTDLT